MDIAFLPEQELAPQIEANRQVRMLDDWCDPCLYYPSRRQPSPACSLVLEALRETGVKRCSD